MQLNVFDFSSFLSREIRSNLNRHFGNKIQFAPIEGLNFIAFCEDESTKE